MLNTLEKPLKGRKQTNNLLLVLKQEWRGKYYTKLSRVAAFETVDLSESVKPALYPHLVPLPQATQQARFI